MKKLMTNEFRKWAKKEKIPHEKLAAAIDEVNNGIVEANLGGYLYKKRIALHGKGKSKGARTIICCKVNNRAIFLHGFSKSEKSNLSTKEQKLYKEAAKAIMSMSIAKLNAAISKGVFIEVE